MIFGGKMILYMQILQVPVLTKTLMPSIRLEMMDHSQSLLSGLLWPYMIPTIIIYGICAFKTHATLGTTIMFLWSLEKHTGSNVLSVTFKREETLKL